MKQATLHPLPPDILDEPEPIDLHSSGGQIERETIPPTSPTPAPK